VSGLDEPAAIATLAEPTSPAVSPEIAALISETEQLFKAGKSRQALGSLWRGEAAARDAAKTQSRSLS